MGRDEEVAEEDHDALSDAETGDGGEGVVEGGFAGAEGLGGGGSPGGPECVEEEVSDGLDVSASSEVGERGDASGGGGMARGEAEDGESDAVVLDESDAGEGEGEAGGEHEFVGDAGVHGGGGVDGEVESEVFLFEEEFDEEAVETGVDIPVDEAEIVARGVESVVVELDGSASAFAAAFALEFAGEDAAASEVEAFDAGEEAAGDEVVDAGGMGAARVWEHGEES